MAEILITSEFFGKFSQTAHKMLIEAGHKVVDNPRGHQFLTPCDIIPHAKTANAFICDLERIDKDVMDSAPSLMALSRRGVGVDSIDLEYAKKRGIEILRTPGVVEAPVAELVLGYILEFSRNIGKFNADMQVGTWQKRESHSIENKVLGIFGMGKIAFETARRAAAFGMEIIYCGRSANADAEKTFGAKRLTADEVLAKSDFLSLHLPLTAETAGMFDYETICKMKKTSVLINTARGAIVNENDLARALCEGKISGAAVDVFDVEPKTNSPLMGMKNVLLTPHVGTYTQEVYIKMDILAAKNLIEFFAK